MKFLIIGLGNIGTKYEHTRHNIGFDVLDQFVLEKKGQFENSKLAQYALIKYRGKQFHCIKPNTYMNLSGDAVRYWMQKLKIEVGNMMVIADDIALPVGKLRLRAKGTDAGHNGLKHIAQVLNTIDYPRLRFGVGNEFEKGMQVEFVLGKWPESEQSMVRMGIQKALTAIELFAIEGCDRAMNKINSES